MYRTGEKSAMKRLEARLVDNTHLELKEPIPEGLDEVVVKIKKLDRSSVKSSKFFGLWKDREDIKDGLSYVTEIRRRSRY